MVNLIRAQHSPFFFLPADDGDAMCADCNVTVGGTLVGGDAAEELLAVATELLDLLQQPVLGRLGTHRQLGQFAVLHGNLAQKVNWRLAVGARQDDVLLVDAQRIACQTLVQA